MRRGGRDSPEMELQGNREQDGGAVVLGWQRRPDVAAAAATWEWRRREGDRRCGTATAAAATVLAA